MGIKETEKLLEESANNVKMRDFSEVWQEIKEDVQVVPKKPWSKKYFPTILAACLAFIFAIALPIYFLNTPEVPEEIYYFDKLVSVEVDELTFFSDLSKANVTHVSFEEYMASGFTLYQTDNNIIKGGLIDLYDNIDAPTVIVKLNFYDESVKIDSILSEKVYSETYSKDGLSVSYNVGECHPEYNIYSYDIFATFNKVNYIIDYMGTASNPIDFFDSFFK